MYIKECEERNYLFREMDFNRNDRQKVYAKDSMDRFGDDLTEEILQYMTFEDKIRLECVSKQWKRCVFQRQSTIEIMSFNSLNPSLILLNNNKQYNKEMLESVLKKCPNITTLRLKSIVSMEVLSLIGQYCLNVKSLRYETSDRNLSFFYLEELHLIVPDDTMKDVVKLCPNLKRLWFFSCICVTNDIELVPKLEQIKECQLINYKEMNKMKLFYYKVRRTQKTLVARLAELKAEELKTCIDCISRFENLKQLELHFLRLKTTEPIDDCLSLIGRKCTKLLKLNLYIHSSVLISVPLIKTFCELKAIKKLIINFKYKTVLSGSIECFKHCKQLIELDIFCDKLTEDFFTNIQLFVPKLQTLRIETTEQFSDTFIDSFHSMKFIQKVILFNRFDENRKKYYFGKSLSEVMLSPIGMNVIRVNDNCGLVNYDEDI